MTFPSNQDNEDTVIVLSVVSLQILQLSMITIYIKNKQS